jgi:hypothetical protein
VNEEEKKLLEAVLEQLERLNTAIVMFSNDVHNLASLFEEEEFGTNPPEGPPSIIYN